jgi:hypothetical protein
MQYETTTGIIEITPHHDTIGIVIKSPHHEVGINIPKSNSWSFLNRRYYEGSHESVEVTVKGSTIIITFTVNFKTESHTTAIVTRDTWSQIESQIKRSIK